MNYYIRELKQTISLLPQGYISQKMIKGKVRYYYQWREGKRIKSRYLKDFELEDMRTRIDERRNLQDVLKRVESLDRRVRAYAKAFYMSRSVSVGEQAYENIISGKKFYVDKTHLIRDWWESDIPVSLITRPRRFGKTLNLSMLECFFSVKYANRSDLFEGLFIWSLEKYRSLQGTVPVLRISLAGVKNIDTYRESISWSIGELFAQNRYLLDTACRSTHEIKLFETYESRSSITEAGKGIRYLCELLSRYHGQKPILLIDEYDTPLHEAYATGKLDDVMPYTREFFHNALKDNPWLGKALLTGITQISRESLFSGMNHMQVFTTTSDRYETAFGFTEEEVFDALDEQGMGNEETRRQVHSWYDGFQFGHVTDIYNPWSISCFLLQILIRTIVPSGA